MWCLETFIKLLIEDIVMIHVILGTKAQFIKMAMILKEFDRLKVEYNLIHTHQHTEITEKISENFKLKNPDKYLVKRNGDIVSSIQVPLWYLKCIFNGKKVLNGKKGICLLHGDTPSTLLGVIIAKINGIKIAHIEAGLRSYSLINPFPEEIIRRITTRFSDYLFAPSDWAYNNLLKEKVNGKIFNTDGNTVFDAIRFILKSNVKIKIPKEKYVIALMHRNETILIKSRFKAALYAVEKASEKFKVIFVLHKPTEIKLKEYGLFDSIKKNENIILKPYYDYFSFMKLINNAEFIMADGGTLQEETFYLNKPYLILRERTERDYGLDSTSCLSKLNKEKIDYFIKNYKNFKRKDKIKFGEPSKKIANIMMDMI